MKIFYNLMYILLITLLITSCNEENDEFNEKESSFYLSKEKINQEIIRSMEKDGKFDWKKLSDETVFAALKLSNNYLSVAWDYRATTKTDRDKILQFIYNSEQIKKVRSKDSSDKILIELDDELKIMLVHITKKETLIGLRNMSEVKVVEPAYSMYSKEEAIAASNTYKEPIKTFTSYHNTDEKTNKKSENIKYFSPFDNHHIPAAWNAGIDGSNITVAVIDGGLIKNDPVWGANGNDVGLNTHTRTVEKNGFYKYLWWSPLANYDGWDTGLIQAPASHGVSRCNEIAGPLGPDTGIAYHSNIISIRSSWGVWIDPMENSMAVAKSYKYLANRDDVKIISMSQGSILDWIWITRAIELCNDKGKLMFAAGGTFFAPGAQHILTSLTGFTLFPARLPHVHSCTGIRKLESTKNKYHWGTICFGKADFVFEFNETWTQHIGQGSSSASTASTAGMAALIWSDNPTLNREQILQKMKNCADFPQGTNEFYGYGRIDMQKYVNQR